MRCHLSIGALVIALLAGVPALAAEPQCGEPARDCYVGRFRPVGGWSPYGSGLLHWWERCCFPRCGGPDDYCRKPLPRVCWKSYPPYYIWGPPQTCSPPGKACYAENPPSIVILEPVTKPASGPAR
jgi:hypothetical protein